MTPSQIVELFASTAARCIAALADEFEGTERSTVWTGLFLRPRDGSEPVRSGELEGIGTFTLHGRGCQFELESGEDVDVDWDEEGRAVFDSWRILLFARSVGVDSVDQESLRAAAAGTVSVRQIAPDTFTWPDGRYDMVWGET